MIEPTSDARQYRIIIRGECGRLLVSLIGNVEVESAQGGKIPQTSCSVKAGEALGRDTEFVALRILHDGPPMAAYLVFSDDRGAKPH